MSITNRTETESAVIACQRDEQDLQGHTGRHCQHPGCARFDLLPYHCEQCSKYYCSEHSTFESHGCERVDKRLPQCPLCNQAILVRSNEGETADRAVDAHIMSGCQSHLADKIRRQREVTNRCMHGKGKKACKDTSLLKYHCKDCGKTFCMAHRHHKCKPIQSCMPCVNAGPNQTRQSVSVRG